MYLKISKLPSGFTAYPEGTEIRIRELTFGEVLKHDEYSDRPLDILEYFSKKELVTGIDFWEITAGDWEFLLLQIVAISYATPSYTFRDPLCPSCKEKQPKSKEEIIAAFPVPIKFEGFKPENIPPDLEIKLEPATIIFVELDETVTGQATIELTKKKVTLDFYRLKHYKQLLEADMRNIRANEIAILTGLDMEADVSDLDYAILDAAYVAMDHGLARQIEITCPDCGEPVTKEVRWDISSLIPFYRDGAELKDRISFGVVSESADNPYKKTTVSPSRSSLRPADGETNNLGKPDA
jgi:hypothetical protein